ncbi:MAG: glycosyltransferase family 2 protein [Candidatus Kapabacteria bacterium]|nr:glycosyltransferase family 2 protein [Candidatus Kapabacteria bacterium]
MQSKISIGVAIIAKNNADTIAETLESVRPFVRQIVVVDTGSSDATPQICTRFGAEVYFHGWKKDFSYSRNLAISYMRTPWILSIDSDERIESLDLHTFAELASDDVGGLSVIINNLLSTCDSSQYSTHRFTRIFRNSPQIRYSGTIHEQIADSILNAGYRIADSDFSIIHTGYANTDEKKIRRNEELLVSELQKSDNPDWTRYHLASTEFAAHNFKNAEELFRQIVDSPALTLAQQQLSRIRLAQIALHNSDCTAVNSLLNFRGHSTEIEGFRKFILATGLILLHDYSTASEFVNAPETTSSPLVSRETLRKMQQLLATVMQ